VWKLAEPAGIAVTCLLNLTSILEGFRGDKGGVYGAYRVRMRLADSTGEEKLTEETFFGVDLKGLKILLGRP
jgi:hypothetical protein